MGELWAAGVGAADLEMTRPDLALQDWLRDIAESEAQLAAGLIVSGETVLQELRDDIARLQAKLGGVSVFSRDIES